MVGNASEGLQTHGIKDFIFGKACQFGRNQPSFAEISRKIDDFRC